MVACSCPKFAACVCCRVSGATQQTHVKITTLVNMAAYASRLTVGPYANAETSTLKGYFARKVGTVFKLHGIYLESMILSCPKIIP
jgi:hypothetical protein